MNEQAPIEPATLPVLTIADGRATVRLNRPRQHNRLEPADVRELTEMFGRVDADPSVRVLVLTGTGKSFSSGFHIGALVERGDYDPKGFERMVDRLEALRVPTIAALNGSVYGGSTDLALACDFRIGVTGMRMFMPAARLGIVYYASGMRRYVTRLGLAAAKKLFLTAQPMQTDELLRVGYLDEAVAPDRLAARVDELAATLARNAPLALPPIKRALNEIAAGTLDLEELEEARRRCAKSEDHQEGLRAWAEKRDPAFKGR
jgi:enoyl-CoA hydratase/carnithine racemase